MKAAFFWLCLFVFSLASLEGRTAKKNKPIQFNVKSLNKIEPRHKNEKWRKEELIGKNTRCFFLDNSRKVRCSSVKKCPSQNPFCRSFGQIRRTMERVHENKFQETSVTHEQSLRSKCSDKKNPLCIHDIWVGRKRAQEKTPAVVTDSSLRSQLNTALCDPKDEICLLATKRAEEVLGMSSDKREGNTKPEKVLATIDKDLNPARPSSNPRDCDPLRDPNCRQDDYTGRTGLDRDILKKFNKLPTLKRQRVCKGGKPNKVCRWRPQPNDQSLYQLSSRGRMNDE